MNEPWPDAKLQQTSCSKTGLISRSVFVDRPKADDPCVLVVVVVVVVVVVLVEVVEVALLISCCSSS